MGRNNGEILDALSPGSEICGSVILAINTAKNKRFVTYDTRCHCGHERTLTRQGMLTRLHQGSTYCPKCRSVGQGRHYLRHLPKHSSVAETYLALCDQWLPSPGAIAFARGRV